MSEQKTFSIEQSEELIAQLKTETSSEFEQLRSALKLLAHVPELSTSAVPPALPSTVHQNVLPIALKPAKSHRRIITSLIAIGIFASASLAAAAVTGNGPGPIVAVANKTVKFVKEAVGSVAGAVTGNNSSTLEDQTNSPGIPDEENPSDESEESEASNSDVKEDPSTPSASSIDKPAKEADGKPISKTDSEDSEVEKKD